MSKDVYLYGFPDKTSDEVLLINGFSHVNQLIGEYNKLAYKIKQLEEDYKNELEENLKMSELWRKSQEKVSQLETNRDELKKWLEEEKNKHYDRKWLSDDELCYRLEDNSAKTLIEVQTKMEILERGKE